MKNTPIHYSSTMKLTELKSQGEGACGEQGYISGYPGIITCGDCKKIMKQEQAQSFASTKTILK